MSHGTAYTYPATGYAPQQYSYPSQQSSYPAQQYPHTAQQYQYAYYDQQYATGGSYPPSASHPSQPMGQSNGYASGAHASAKAPIPNAQPKLRAADVMRSVKVEGNKVHHYVYTNEKIRVPLPAGVDPNWLLEVYSIPEPSGRQAVVHGLTLPRRVKDFEKALKNINRSVLHAYTPLSALGVHADNIYVHRGILPFQRFDFESCDMVSNCLRSSDGILPTFGLLLTKMIYEQLTWIETLVNREDPVWFMYRDNEIWGRWAENPRPDCLSIRSIRRTLPDANGVVYYFPELELMPMVLQRETRPAPVDEAESQ